MKIGIGIDTGGTCTDAVAYDFDTSTLIAKGKALTTRENLSIGIGNALDQLPPELIRDAQVVSLSTTLATNACLEGKGGRAKLVIFGLTDEIIIRFDAEARYGIKRDSVLTIDKPARAEGLEDVELDWEAILEKHGSWLQDADALSTAELYSMNNGAPSEKRLKELADEYFKLPCVSASEFISDVNVLTRSATALLNARMFPIIQEFVETAIADFEQRECTAPVMVVRSDGSMMSSDLSMSRPVETILSGPAASALAGKAFCEDQDFVIIDMGGTTTDISVVHKGKPVMVEEGILLAGWRTAVKGVLVSPFALGGDSTVRLVEGRMRLFDRRSTPICVAATRWPEIKDMLRNLLKTKHVNKFPLHEFLYLVREPAEQKSYNDDELALLERLRKGPCILENLKDEAGIDLYSFSSERLEEEGIVMRCGLTPTDFMHLKGDYVEFDTEASEIAARYILYSLKRTHDVATDEEIAELADSVYDLVQGRMYENLVRVMLARQYPKAFKEGVDAQTDFLIKEAWATRDSEQGSIFKHTFTTKAALIGIGAPTHIFLPAVAKALDAPCILPEHAEVANALGALKASINVVQRIEISHIMSLTIGPYYIVHTPKGSRQFKKLDEAIELAKAEAEEAAIIEARSRGAVGELVANTYVENQNVINKEGASVNFGHAVISEVNVIDMKI
ncbi:MAG: hypothetical protein FWG30_02575 [Eubacteriaceae bacterium]|nr:hypothetical protein [Eubacteriaceae bacterium]